LGEYIGEEIYRKYLPALKDICFISSRVIYEVTPEEKEEYDRLYKAWSDKIKDLESKERNEATKEEWDAHLKNLYTLQNKYFPPILECYVPFFDVEGEEEIFRLKKGIEHALWNCDMCSYHCKPEDIEIEINREMYFSIIRLKLDTGEGRIFPINLTE
jgi:hypothetical protein